MHPVVLNLKRKLQLKLSRQTQIEQKNACAAAAAVYRDAEVEEIIEIKTEENCTDIDERLHKLREEKIAVEEACHQDVGTDKWQFSEEESSSSDEDIDKNLGEPNLCKNNGLSEKTDNFSEEESASSEEEIGIVSNPDHGQKRLVESDFQNHETGNATTVPHHEKIVKNQGNREFYLVVVQNRATVFPQTRDTVALQEGKKTKPNMQVLYTLDQHQKQNLYDCEANEEYVVVKKARKKISPDGRKVSLGEQPNDFNSPEWPISGFDSEGNEAYTVVSRKVAKKNKIGGAADVAKKNKISVDQPKPKPGNCEIVSQQVNLTEHSQKQERPELCTICGILFQNMKILKLHARSTHSENHLCDLCGQFFINPGYHKKCAYQLDCSICGYTAVTKLALTYHEMSHSKVYPCTECKHPFKTKYDLEKHKKMEDLMVMGLVIR